MNINNLIQSALTSYSNQILEDSKRQLRQYSVIGFILFTLFITDLFLTIWFWKWKIEMIFSILPCVALLTGAFLNFGFFYNTQEYLDKNFPGWRKKSK